MQPGSYRKKTGFETGCREKNCPFSSRKLRSTTKQMVGFYSTRFYGFLPPFPQLKTNPISSPWCAY